MMSPAEHYAEADKRAAKIQEMSDEAIRLRHLSTYQGIEMAKDIQKSLPNMIALAQLHATLATIPEGVYQMARGL